MKKEVDDAIEKAKNDPFPDPAVDLYSDVYKNNEDHYLRNVEYEYSQFSNKKPIY